MSDAAWGAIMKFFSVLTRSLTRTSTHQFYISPLLLVTIMSISLATAIGALISTMGCMCCQAAALAQSLRRQGRILQAIRFSQGSLDRLLGGGRRALCAVEAMARIMRR